MRLGWSSLLLVLQQLSSVVVNHVVEAAVNERSALSRFFDVTDGERWVNNTNWKVDGVPICSWHGIICAGGASTDDEGVTAIQLQNNNLVGHIAKLLYEMEHLKVLNLRDNKLRSGDFEAFKEPETENSIQILNLAGNAITNLTGIGAAPTSLTELHVTANSIQGDFPAELTNLVNLQILSLSFNRLSGSIPTEIGKMTNLESLVMYENDLSGSLPSEIGLLQKVKVFNVAENAITGSLPRTVNDMVDIQTFSIHNNEQKKSKLIGTLPWFYKSPFLDQLYLDGNALTGTIPHQLMRNSNVTSKLVTIGLSYNQFTGSLPDSLLKFSSLFINLAGNQLTTLDPAFCTMGAWMSGLVEEHGCDAMLCPRQTYSPVGRVTDSDTCDPCVGAGNALGATECQEEEEEAPADWYILAEFYRDLMGAQWDRTKGWDSLNTILAFENLESYDGPPLNVCGWAGVECNAQGRVRQLSLSFNNLFGTIPNSIFSLPALEVLDVSRNPVVFGDLANIQNATQLRSLSIGETKVKTLAGLEQAPSSLKLLYLDSLSLEVQKSFPTQLYALTNLEILHLHFMHLSGKLPTELGALVNLERLILYKTGLTGTLPTELGLMNKMNWLDLSENAFTGTIPTQLDAMTNLNKFLVHQTGGGFTGELPLFNKFPKLVDLSLDYNKFTGAIPPQFLQGVANKAHHVTVSITNNLLTGIVPATLDNFEDMDIRLEENQFTGVDLALCDNPKWMNGQVGAQIDATPCDAILCPDGFHGDYGKAVGGSLGICVECASASYFGTVQCNDEDPNPAKTILDKLFKDTGGRYWKRHANWTRPSVPICHREGIVCAGADSELNIAEMELVDNNLKGTIPPEVFDVIEIRLLDFTNNQVDLSFARMDRAQRLVVLKLSNTQVRSLEHLDKAAPSLKEIHLAGNQLDGPIPDVVYDLPNVRKIFLSNNAFTGSLSDAIADMTALQELELAGNKLTGAIPTVLGALPDLRRLQLSNNGLSGNLPTELNNLSLLTGLILGGQHSNQKLSGPLVRFSHAPELKTLDLRDNDFSGTIPGNFLDQTASDASVYVNLSNNRISGTLPAYLSQLQSLFIDLSDNEITVLFDGSFNCSNVGGWMDGGVGSLDGSCDAILCIPGSASPKGFQEPGGEPCGTCERGLLDAPFYGATNCKPHANKQTEQGILEEFYIKTNGTEWVDQTGWNSQSSVCTWFGVTCDDKGVSEINLDSNGLEASEDVSHLLFALPNLQKLDIKGNNAPLDLTKIKSDSPLQVLKLSATGLKSIDGITNAKDLRRLHVTDNDLQGPFPKEFGQLTNLQSLFLSFNSFTGALPDECGNLTELIELYVYGNMISGTIPGETIAKLTNLKDFILSNNYLTGTIPNVFNSLSNLEQLSLFDQQSASLISGTVPNFLGATALWYFDATNNDLTGSIPNDFLKNSIYKSRPEDNDMTVYLDNNELTGALPTSLAGFSSLDIQITGNSITEIPDEFCDKDLWMQGKVLGVGCDAIACPPGKYTNVGRQDSASNVCRDCSLLAGDNRYGQTFCEDFTSEKATLLALYNATNGDGWDEYTSWGTTSPVCSWVGIECENGSDDDDNGVTGIDLEDNYLVGSLPTSIWKLPFLKSLNLKDNFGMRISLEGLSSASNLELVYLSGTRVDSLYGISQGSAIRQLHLTDCGISGPLPDEIYDMTDSLEGLFIAYNAFTGTISTRIGRLIKLESFYAYDNDFDGTIPTQIGQMLNLRNIVLSENLLTGSIPSQVSSLNNLELFSAFRRIKPGDRITGRLPAFDKNPKLQDIYIDNNDITGSIPSNFLAASSRADLLVTLSHNDLTGVVPQSIVSIDVLSIWLEGNEITAFPPEVCNKTFWMEGAIGSVGCSAFLCPVGTHSSLGRANSTITCQGCEEQGAALYLGSTNCETPDDERKILMQLYQACGGTAWYNSNDWATSTDFCSWHGIECEFGHVISIKLGSNNLVGTPPKEIFDLPELKILELYSNLISFNFNNIRTASKLTELRLNKTGLESLDGIGMAPALTVLDVRFNNLNKRFFNAEVLELEHLRYLNMANNQMTGNIPVEYFSDMRYLKTLRLGSNQFTGGIPSFSENTRLTTIDLSNNNFSSTIPDNFLDAQTYSTPIVIDLSSNEIRGDIPVAFGRFDHLTLYLHENKITGMPDRFCNRTKWNDGDVGKYGCDAILCPPGTFNTIGRKRDGNEDCRSCKDDSSRLLFFGRTTCPSTPGSSASSRMTTTTSLLAVATVVAYLLL